MHANVLPVVTTCVLMFLESFTHVFNDIFKLYGGGMGDDLSLGARVRPGDLRTFPRLAFLTKFRDFSAFPEFILNFRISRINI